jgi:RHH-type transcriptional regulator, proline utilization regulon repressor / proline dehydrogenase / delta 1-pyrroline-5-carboxylate dehydrogenase
MEDEPSVMSADWWDERMMALTMRDERLKVQLFRFIDVLPVLKRPGQITRHLDEYLRDVVGVLPWPLSQGIDWMPREGWGAAMVAKLALFNTHRLARRFIAGTTVDETVRTIEQLRKRNLTFTIDLLGEAVLSESEADEYQHQYLDFTDGLTRRAARWPTLPQADMDHLGPIPKVNVSVKLSSLFSQFDPIDPANTSRRVRERLRPILRLAKSRAAFVNIDMEQHAFKDATLRIFEEVFSEDEFRDWPDVGIAVQAYLRSCGDDLRRLAAFAERRGTPVWVRLVKGAYWDYETVIAAQQDWPVPVFTDKNETDANFEAMTRFLLERRDVLRPAIASHNVRSIAHALALAEEFGLPARMIEFQMLYGMADPIKSALVDLGQRVRIYTPFGQLLPGMAYLVRRLLENTSNQSFLRAGFLEHVPVEKLLMNPLELVPRTRPSIEVKADRFTNEPPTDFAREDARHAMSRAIEQVRGRLGRL